MCNETVHTRTQARGSDRGGSDLCDNKTFFSRYGWIPNTLLLYYYMIDDSYNNSMWDLLVIIYTRFLCCCCCCYRGGSFFTLHFHFYTIKLGCFCLFSISFFLLTKITMTFLLCSRFSLYMYSGYLKVSCVIRSFIQFHHADFFMHLCTINYIWIHYSCPLTGYLS